MLSTLINKGTVIKTAGWVTVGIGLYLIAWGTSLDGDSPVFTDPNDDDNIIDAEWYNIE